MSVFPVFGNGDCPVQPVCTEDPAVQVVDAGSRVESLIADAAELETFTFEELLRLLDSAVSARARLVHTPLPLGFTLIRLVGLLLRDVVLTRDEVDGLMAGLLTSESIPMSSTRLADWFRVKGEALGQRYVSELRRNLRRRVFDALGKLQR